MNVHWQRAFEYQAIECQAIRRLVRRFDRVPWHVITHEFQATLESCGIEFPEGTSSVCVALRLKPGERLSQVAAKADLTMPVGLRFWWSGGFKRLEQKSA